MNWIFRLETKFGRYAIPNLLRYMVGAQAVFYVLEFAAAKGPQSSILPHLILLWDNVLAGEWWRIFTFYMIPPSWHPIWVIFYVMIVFSISNGMERAWGSFRINLYALLGLLSHIALAAYFGFALPSHLVQAFLIAYAVNYGDDEIRLYFLIPIKWRWIGWIFAALIVKDILFAPLAYKAMALTSLGVLYLFVGPDLVKRAALRAAAVKSRQEFEQKKIQPRELPNKACAQCGRNDEDAHPRLCTCDRCGEDGRFWCEEHLGPHLGK